MTRKCRFDWMNVSFIAPVRCHGFNGSHFLSLLKHYTLHKAVHPYGWWHVWGEGEKRERKKKRWWRFLLLNTAEWGHPNQSDFPRWWRCWAAASAAPAAAADDAAPYPSVCLRIWLRWGTSSPEEEKKETEERETDPNWVVARNRTADKMHSNCFSNNLKSPFFFVRQTGPTGRWRL